jgi:hypothetical protein
MSFASVTIFYTNYICYAVIQLPCFSHEPFQMQEYFDVLDITGNSAQEFICSLTPSPGACGSVVVKALRYWSDGPRIDSRWYHWGFFPWIPMTEPRVLGLNQLLKMSTKDFSCGKGGRCLWLTLVVPNVKKIRGLNLIGTLWATSAYCGRSFYFIRQPFDA